MPKRPFRTLAALTLLAAGLFGCDGFDLPSAPSDGEGSRFTFVTRKADATGGGGSSTVVQVVGTHGGQIDVGGHSLIIPEGAVSEDTEFTFTAAGGNYIQVELDARQVSDSAVVDTFPVALTLRLSYAEAEVNDPEALANAYLIHGTVEGDVEVLPSSIDTTTQTVSSPLTHFSTYAMGIN